MSYQDSLRQQAQWVREALDPAVPPSQRITIDDVDFDELEAAADHIDALVKALRDIIEANKEFRAGMPDGWEGDPLQDACETAEGLLASVGEERKP